MKLTVTTIGLVLLTTAIAADYKSFASIIPYKTLTERTSIPFSILNIRGGSYSEDEYDEYDEEDDDEDDEQIYSSRRPPPRMNQPPPRRNLPPRPKRKKSKHWTQRMASQSLQMGGKLAWNSVKQPGKLAYHLIRPKHVHLGETGGLWRLDQQITMKGDRLVASVATVEFDPRKRQVLVRQKTKSPESDETNEKVISQPYTFSKSRLGFYKSSFVAPAFLIGDTPRLYGYKGTWTRKVGDTNVIKLVGKIYQVRTQKFGRERGAYLFGKEVGTFVARRRVQIVEDEDDEYDEYDDEELEDDMTEDEESYDFDDDQSY